MPDWNELCRLDPRVWELLLLRASPAANKAPGSDVRRYLDAAEGWGREQAEKTQPEQIAEQLKADKVRVIRSREPQPLMIHSDYCWDRKGAEIHLYLPVILRIRSILLNRAQETDPQTLLDLHLAHEYFHHMVRSGKTTAPEGVRLRRDLFAPRRDPMLEELAAHVFAWQLCRFPCHPMVLDWLLMEEEAPVRAGQILREMTVRALNLERNTL